MIGGYVKMTSKKTNLMLRLSLIFLLLAVMVMMAAGISAAAETKLRATGKVNSWNGAYVRAKATTASDQVIGLVDNTKVKIKKEVFVTNDKTGAIYKWYYITAKKKKGYIRSDLVDTIKYKTTSIGKTTGKVNYRYGAGTSMKKAGRFSKGQELTIVLEAKAKDKSVWYKVRYGKKYYYVIASKVKIVEEKTVAETVVSTLTGTTDPSEVVQTKAARKIAKRSAAWARDIANDNTFHYGNGLHAHHNGCYFCGTQPKSKQKHVKKWQKTYCCNPFVTAAYAHGGNEPFMLDLCQHGKSYMAPEFKKCDLFANLGHPKQADLKVGDILCSTGHVAIYLGNNQIAEACTTDDGKPGSSKWNASIAVNTLTAKRYKGFKAGVFRYIGKQTSSSTETSSN